MKTKSNYKSRLLSLAAVVLGFVSFSFSQQLAADTLPIPVAEQGNQTLPVPKNGLKMQDVEQQYGAPVEKLNPVGEPPITRWIYPEFTVYFENNTVLHSVIRKG